MIKRKIRSVLLGLLVLFASLQPLVFPETETMIYADPLQTPDMLREQIINTALGYVGYGYSQENRNAKAGTVDCSSLVRLVYEQNGFSDVPTTTAMWMQAFANAKNTGKLMWNGTHVMKYQGRELKAAVWNGSGEAPKPGTYDVLLREYANGASDINGAHAIYRENAKPGDVVIHTNGHAAITLGISKNIYLDAAQVRTVAPTIGTMLRTDAPAAIKGIFTARDAVADVRALANEYQAWMNLFEKNTEHNYLAAIKNRDDLGLSGYRETPFLYCYNDDISNWFQVSDNKMGVSGTILNPNMLSLVNNKLYPRSGLIVDYSTSQINSFGMTAPSDIWRIEALNEQVGVAITNNFAGKSQASSFFVMTLAGEEAHGTAQISAVKSFHNEKGEKLPMNGGEFLLRISGVTAPAGNAVPSVVYEMENDATGTFRWVDNQALHFDYRKGFEGHPDVDMCGDWIYRIEELPGSKAPVNVSYEQEKFWKVQVRLSEDHKTLKTDCFVADTVQGPWRTYQDASSLIFENQLEENDIRLQLMKKDTYGNALSQIAFRVYTGFSPADGKLTGEIAALTTGKDGRTDLLELTNVKEGGTLYIKEVSAVAPRENSRITVSENIIAIPYRMSTQGSGASAKRVLSAADPVVYTKNPQTGAYTAQPISKETGIEKLESNVSSEERDLTVGITVLNRVDYYTTFSVEKRWDTGVDRSKANTVEVTLMRNGEAVKTLADGRPLANPVTLSAQENWKYTWKELDQYDAAGKPYVYTVKETKVNGVSLDQSDYVSVVKDGIITNYEPKAETTLTVEKQLLFRDFLVDDRFVVTVKALDPKDPNYAALGKEAGISVELTYADLKNGYLQRVLPLYYSYAEMGRPQKDQTTTYTYTIQETANNKSKQGVSSDPTTYQVTVKVTYHADAHTMTVEHAEGYTQTVKNTYTSQGTFQLSAIKELLYAGDESHKVALKKGQFTFQAQYTGTNEKLLAAIQAAGGSNGILTAQNEADGSITFGAVQLDGKDMEGSYDFIITEAAGSEKHIDYDDTYYKITVVAEDDGEGHLITKIYIREKGSLSGERIESDDEEPEGIVFINWYNAVGSVQVRAFKTFTDGVLKGNEFAFRLHEPTGNLIRTVDRSLFASNDAQGNVVFAAIPVYESQCGDYTLTLEEVIPQNAPAYLKYDTKVHELKLSIRDNGDGTLTCDFKEQGNSFGNVITVAFENQYLTQGSFALSGTKEVVLEHDLDHKLPIAAGEYEFTAAYQGDQEAMLEAIQAAGGKAGVLTAKVRADGTFVFPTVAIRGKKMEGTYSFVIREVPGDKSYMTYDDREMEMLLTVSDDGKGHLSTAYALVEHGIPIADQQPHFINRYHAEVRVSIETFKKYEGGMLKGGEFAFILSQIPGQEDMGLLETPLIAANKADGSVVFPEILLHEAQAGTYFFELTEKNGGASFIEYDDTKYMLTLIVTDHGDGRMSYELTGDGKEWVPTDNAFINREVLGSLNILKRGLSAKGEPLAGAGFEIRNVTTQETLVCPDSKDGIWYTAGKNGELNVYGLPMGDYLGEDGSWRYYVYTVEEVVAPAGYNRSSEIWYFSFEENPEWAGQLEQEPVMYQDHLHWRRSLTVVDTIELGLEENYIYIGFGLMFLSAVMTGMMAAYTLHRKKHHR